MNFDVQVDGLNTTALVLRAMNRDLHTRLKVLLNETANVVASEARSRVPHKSGRLAGSIRAASTATQGRVAMGSARVPYAGFIEFGGSTGRGHRPRVAGSGSIKRPFVKPGRYLRPALDAKRTEIEVLADRLVRRAVHKEG